MTKSFRLATSVLLLAAVYSGALAEPSTVTTVAGIKGQCEVVSLAGIDAKCALGSGVIYSSLSNGRVLFSFALSDGRVVSFVGEKDSQPRPEEYFLYLSRVRVASKGSGFTATIAGQCKVSMSTDGKFWSLIQCDATDENSARYALRFASDGTPVDVQHAGGKSAAMHVDQKAIGQVTARFKAAMQKSGIHGVVSDIEYCFDHAVGNVPAIRFCMLYDIAAVNFDKSMRKLFVSRGVEVGEQIPFLADRASNARMEIYSGMAFGGSEDAARQFFGNAPIQVINSLSK